MKYLLCIIVFLMAGCGGGGTTINPPEPEPAPAPAPPPSLNMTGAWSLSNRVGSIEFNLNIIQEDASIIGTYYEKLNNAAGKINGTVSDKTVHLTFLPRNGSNVAINMTGTLDDSNPSYTYISYTYVTTDNYLNQSTGSGEGVRYCDAAWGITLAGSDTATVHIKPSRVPATYTLYEYRGSLAVINTDTTDGYTFTDPDARNNYFILEVIGTVPYQLGRIYPE